MTSSTSRRRRPFQCPVLEGILPDIVGAQHIAAPFQRGQLFLRADGGDFNEHVAHRRVQISGQGLVSSRLWLCPRFRISSLRIGTGTIPSR